MSHVIMCDVCSSICATDQYFALQGWLGTSKYYSGKGKQGGTWDIEPCAEVKGLVADVCADCLTRMEIASRCSEEKTRDTLVREMIEQNPGISMLKVLRKTALPSVFSVNCNLCQSNCIDKHLQISSGWVTQGNRIAAQICEPCVSERLQPLVRFQVTPAKLQA